MQSRWKLILAAHLAVDVLLPLPGAGSETEWQEVIPPNAAYHRARQRQPFSMDDPVGLVSSEATREEQRQAARRLREAIGGAIERGEDHYTIPPGEYRFSDNRGFVLQGVEDLEILARGVTFWFERPASMLAADPRGLELRECRNVAIRGLAIDFDPPVFLQARILDIDGDAPGYLIRIDPDFPDAEMSGGSYFLYRANGQWIPHGYLFYQRTERVEGRTHRVVLPDARVFQVHNRDPAVQKLTGGASRIGRGDYIVLPWRRGKGIYMYRCEGCMLEDVDEYASPGMGILEHQGNGGNVYRRVRMIPPPGTRRLHVCAADGFHNAQTDRGPQIIGCEITGTSDDFFNLHGHFGVVWHKIGGARYIVGQANLGDLAPGERLVFYDDETVESLGEARIERLEALGDRQLIAECDALTLPRHANRDYHEITLDREVALSPGDLVALERFRSAGFLIKDCYFHDAMARSLVNGAGDGRIVGNVIERAAWGLVIHFETWQYYEGPMVRNLEISGNVLREIRDLSLPHHATGITVTMVPTHGGYLRKARPLRNIRITGNYIENVGGFGILLTNTRGATITKNTIVRPMYRPAMTGGDLSTIQFNIGHADFFRGNARRAAISLWSSSDVDVENNRIIDPEGNCRHGRLQVGEHCTAIRGPERS